MVLTKPARWVKITLVARECGIEKTLTHAALAHLVERHLAKVEVASSSLVSRSTWGFSSAGRAPALQAGGHRFEPCCSHHFWIWPGSSVG